MSREESLNLSSIREILTDDAFPKRLGYAVRVDLSYVPEFPLFLYVRKLLPEKRFVSYEKYYTFDELKTRTMIYTVGDNILTHLSQYIARHDERQKAASNVDGV